jgi:catalase
MEYQNTSSGFQFDPHNLSAEEKVFQKLMLNEKLSHFNREKIPERITHAKGAGAFGSFEVTKDLKQFTKAKIFSAIGNKVKVFVRFSNYRGEKGSSDTLRDPRGFAIRFFTEEGNWDIAGNNIPIFYIRDAFKLPDLIHSQRRDPKSNLYSNETLWDFYSLNPETLHGILMNYSSRGIPKSYSNMDGFSCHAFSFINSLDEKTFVKFHFKTLQGIKNLTSMEANNLAEKNPDFYSEQLYKSIQNDEFPKWKLFVQIATWEDLYKFDFDPFDVTKVWQHHLIPELEVGILELNENPENYFSEVEQVAFSPGNLIGGIGLSPDKLLQARIFAYPDAQRYRLGANFHQLEINKPKVEIKNHYADGFNANNPKKKENYNYFPNSKSDFSSKTFSDTPNFPKETLEKTFPLDEYSQARILYNNFSNSEKQILIESLIESMQEVSENILFRQAIHFYRIHSELSLNLATSFGLNFEEIKRISLLSNSEINQITSLKDKTHEFLEQSQ